MRAFFGPCTALCLLGFSPLRAQEKTVLPSKTTIPARISAPAPVRVATSMEAKGTPVNGRTLMVDADRQGLPFLHEEHLLGANASGFTVYLTQQHYALLSSEELDKLPGLGTPGAEPEILHSLGYSRKRPVALVDIYPYRRDAATGQLERLTDYVLQFVEEKRVGGTGHSKASVYPDHSRLASGEWFRFSVTEDGVYKLTYPFLQQLGVNVNGLASDLINIYGNHAGQLPYANSPAKPNDLLQNAIEVDDGGDGQFGPDDYILFYASDAQRWEKNPTSTGFTHVKNVYTDTASYFIGIGVEPPLRVSSAALSTEPATDQVTAFSDRQVIDNDQVNLIKSGRTFFAEVFDLVTTYNYNFSVPYVRATDPLTLKVDVLGRSLNAASSFTVHAGGTTNTIAVAGVSASTSDGPYGTSVNSTFTMNHGEANLPISITYNKSDPVTSLGYMNFLEINDRRDLRMIGNQLLFRDLQSTGAGRISEFTLDLASGVAQIWDITDPTNARSIPFTDSGVQKIFRVATDSLREFIAFKNTGFMVPIAMGRVANQDLHATQTPTDLVIVAPDEFMSEAQRLGAHRADEGLAVVVVSLQQVFNEFSSGQRDGTAIKRYMKMLYDRAGSDTLMLPRYLLLFGDGSYNNLVRASSNQNLVPTYETYDSWTLNKSFTADDYFALLDDNEGEANSDLVDIGVGRLPVSDATQARQAVDKLLNYDKLALLSTAATSCTSGSDGGAGDWRNDMLFCSDDQTGDGFEGQIHMASCDALATKVENEHPCLNINKIYLDAYVQYSTPGGQRYPDAEKELRDRVQKGALMVTYVGHGGEVGWAHERFLDNSTILGWSNLDRLPLFLTATCEFSRWDDPGRTSAGENVFLNPNGGGIGLMTTTRVAYSSTNQVMALNYFGVALNATDEAGRDQRLGDIYRRTKVASTTSQANHRNFVLLGDPSCRLAMARNQALITAITDTSGNAVDTISALSTIRIKGHVVNGNGEVLTDFNGAVIPTVFDKKTQVNTLANDGGNPFPFSVRKNILYRGRASVVNGEFAFTFVVPKDINYEVGPGRIGVYAESLTTNACGFTNDPLVGGSNLHAAEDAQGPKIDLYMNDDRFVPGGITNENPLLYAKLFDDNGINTVGSSIGHDLVATMDANTENPIVLNDVYQADQDTYKSGQVRYRLSNVTEGSHTLDLKAWDVFNNSSTKSTEFVVAPSAELALAHVLNYPNPFTTRTEFYFEHNRPCSTLDCQVQVFTVAGRLVKTLNRRLDCDGFRSEPLAWDGLDDMGDKIGRGVYVYRLSITTQGGETADKFEKLVILR